MGQSSSIISQATSVANLLVPKVSGAAPSPLTLLNSPSKDLFKANKEILPVVLTGTCVHVWTRTRGPWFSKSNGNTDDRQCSAMYFLKCKTNAWMLSAEYNGLLPQVNYFTANAELNLKNGNINYEVVGQLEDERFNMSLIGQFSAWKLFSKTRVFIDYKLPNRLFSLGMNQVFRDVGQWKLHGSYMEVK